MPEHLRRPGRQNGSATRALATAPIGAYPELSPLAVVIMSGSRANRSLASQDPVRPNPVITSSAMNSTSCRRQISRTLAR